MRLLGTSKVRRGGVELLFDWHDLWVGVHWESGTQGTELQICVIPTLRLHVWRWPY